MDWWESPYPGGPMVAVKGFPRPVYPPDAAPQHTPSVDGSDVEAYKRTISRAGRWRWQTFDQAFSNAFSHGKGPNVIDTGVEGIQRQQNMDSPTGFLGKETFDLLRSIIIPEGLPNAGQHAMDARSVELINAAFHRFGGREPSTDRRSSAEARLAKANAEVGNKEHPAQSNRTKYGEWYGMNGVPWCAIFCTWCDQLSGKPSKTFARSVRYSYVPELVNDARLGRNGLALTSHPRPGDLVCYDWGRDGEYDHMGLVYSTPDHNDNFTAIEGNTSTTNNSNGGQVMKRTRNRTYQATLFMRVAE